MRVSEIFNRNKFSFLYLFFVLIIPFIFSSYILLLLYRHHDLLFEFTYLNWALIYILASFLMGLSLTHTTFIAIAGGYFLGYNSILFIVPSYLAAAVYGYYLARLIDHGKLHYYLIKNQETERFISALKDKTFLTIIFSRLSPVLPFAITNSLLSFLKIPFRTYLTASFLGMLPRTLFFTWSGIQLKSLTDIENTTDTLTEKTIVIALILISTGGLFWLLRRGIKKSKMTK